MTTPESSSGPDVPPAEPDALSSAVVADSFSVSLWTLLSRITGVGKIIAIGAVLGPTYLANTYQATNTIPNIVYFGFLAGSLFTSLLVPPLVRHIDAGDSGRVQRIAGGFMGVAMIAFTALVIISILAGPLIMSALSIGIDDSGIAATQRRIGWTLLVMLMPQVVLYGVAGTAGAVMNAHRRFALAAAAPALENIGIIATLVAGGLIFGTGTDLHEVEKPLLLLLGLGSTGAVTLHAIVLWSGAHRLGVTLIPRLGWRDADVRSIIRRAIPSVGNASLTALQMFAVLVVANGVSGGVVAFQLGLNFLWLPTAMAATPVSLALLPGLSRMHDRGDRQLFRDELVRGFALTLLILVPIAVAYVALSPPLARAVTLGEMDTPAGQTLVAVSLASLGIGVLGHGTFKFLSHAAYAQRDARSPFTATAIGAILSLAGMMSAIALDGPVTLAVLGLALSVGNLASAWYLLGKVKRTLPASGATLGSALRRAAGASLIMLVPAYGIIYAATSLMNGRLGDLVAMVLAAVAGATTFIGLQALWHAPELKWLTSAIGGGPKKQSS